MKTEAEARKCWCPFAAVSNVYGSSGHNRPLKVREAWPTEIAAEFTDATKCIASECMAWRWEYTQGQITGIKVTNSGSIGSEAVAEVTKAPEEPPTRGYCGLAGKP